MSNLSLVTSNTDLTAASTNAERIPLNQIRRNPNIDPRKSRNTESYASIRESIRDKGIYTPVMVRPIEGADVPYELVYGNTRYDISVELLLADIPATIRVMTDEEARVAAAIENMQRKDLTPIEEAKHCIVLLADSGNDHDEVCRNLGWSRKMLDSRVLLSKCCDDVAEALVQGHIKIGHAELLAPLPEDMQKQVCAKIIEGKMSVVDTKKRLIEVTLSISSARFDTTDCKTCHHNSGLYEDMFASSLGSAKCQNLTCWDQKTANLISVRLVEAQEDYGTVHTDMTLPTDGYVLLDATGPNGVGTAQMTACISCKSYGAVVSTSQGNEGKVVGGHCFDKKCHRQNVASYKAVIAEANGATPGIEKSAGTTPVVPQNAGVATVAGQSSTKSKPSGSAPAKPQEIKRSIKKEAFALFNNMGAAAIQANRAYVLSISIVSLYLDMRSDLPSELVTKMQATVGFPSGVHTFNRTDFESVLMKRPLDELESILTRMAAATVYRKDANDQFEKSISGAQSLMYIKAAGMNPVDHFIVSERYFKSLTKSGVVADCMASGFAVKFDEVNGEKAFTKLAGGKADELLKAVLAFKDFEWKGYLPETMKIEAHTPSGTV